MSDKAFQRQSQKLLEQAKNIAHPRRGRNEHSEVQLYNSMVLGLHEYYRVATNINLDCERLYRAVMVILTNRLRKEASCRLSRTGRALTPFEREKFGYTKMMRYLSNTKEPIYPVGFIRCKDPMARKRTINPYTPEGREGLHDNLRVNTALMRKLMKQHLENRSIAYMDNRISLFSARQYQMLLRPLFIIRAAAMISFDVLFAVHRPQPSTTSRTFASSRGAYFSQMRITKRPPCPAA